MTKSEMSGLRRIAAFSNGDAGGNPAGVLVGQRLPEESEMKAIAGHVGYSETVFAAQQDGHWQVRYFAPDCEVDFCGHATIALGAILTELNGVGTYPLQTNAGRISVTGKQEPDGQLQIELSSPPTKSGPVARELLEQALRLFDLTHEDLAPAIPPAIANAGNDHLVLALKRRSKLAEMSYDLEKGRNLMETFGLTTINLIVADGPSRFHSRNAFAIGGVAEDPATGAAAAALAGYLRDLDWPHGGGISVTQGSDMGMPSLLKVRIPDTPGSSVHVAGATRDIR